MSHILQEGFADWLYKKVSRSVIRYIISLHSYALVALYIYIYMSSLYSCVRDTCMYVCMYREIYMETYTHACMHALCIHSHTYIHSYIFIHSYICLHVCIRKQTHAWPHTHKEHTLTKTKHVNAYIHTYTIHIHAYIHTCTTCREHHKQNMIAIREKIKEYAWDNMSQRKVIVNPCTIPVYVCMHVCVCMYLFACR